jgi:hypothetical protein
MKTYLNIAAFLAAFVSAVLWFLAAKARVAWSAMGTLGGPAAIVIKDLNRQAKLNKCAAIATGVSTFLNGLATLSGVWD